MFKKMLMEFKEFAMRGSVVDLAVGIIIGGAFGKIVSSTVNDVIMPPIGKLLGGVNFSDLFYCLDNAEKCKDITSLAQAKQAGVAVIAYGSFLQSLLDFIIVAFCIFMLIKGMNKLKDLTSGPKKAADPATKECPFCCTTIPIKATRCGHCTSALA